MLVGDMVLPLIISGGALLIIALVLDIKTSLYLKKKRKIERGRK